MLSSLRDRCVLVTGGASGIGRAVADRLVGCGATVGLNHLPDDDRGKRAVEELVGIGGRVHSVAADVTDETSFSAAVREFSRTERPPDVLIACAGIAQHADFLSITAADWQRMLAVHLNGVRNASRAVLPSMLDSGFGRLIFTSSELALVGSPTLTHYCAAKGAIIAFAKALAREVGPSVTVNCVAPGPTETEMLTSYPDEYNETTRLALPLQSWGDPYNVAWTFLFLASEGGAWYTGQVLSPNGGAVI